MHGQFHRQKSEAKLSGVRPLPSCTVDVIWSQSLHSGATVSHLDPYTFLLKCEQDSSASRDVEIMKEEGLKTYCILQPTTRGLFSYTL